MDFIIDAIVEWLKGLLVDGIMGNLDGLFDNVNQSVGRIATGRHDPADWNAGSFPTDLRNCHSANRRGHPHFCYDL